MAYKEILDTQLDPDAPITSTLGYQFRDNLIETIAGDTTAPRISPLAMGPIVFGDPAVNTNAGWNELASIDIGESRESVVHYSFFGTLNDTSVSGTSDIKFRASVDNVTWVDLDTMASSNGGIASCSVSTVYDGRGVAPYRYYSIYASGDEDHDLSGNSMIALLGTDD